MITSILEIGGIGCLVFTVCVGLMSISGIASEMRDDEGSFRKGFNLKSIIGATLLFGVILYILYLGNAHYANASSVKPTLWMFWLNAFGIFMVIHFYDLLILDYLIIVKWHPKFLNLPNTKYYNSFDPHFKGFVRGIPLGIMAAFLIAVVSVCLI